MHKHSNFPHFWRNFFTQIIIPSFYIPSSSLLRPIHLYLSYKDYHRSLVGALYAWLPASGAVKIERYSALWVTSYSLSLLLKASRFELSGSPHRSWSSVISFMGIQGYKYLDQPPDSLSHLLPTSHLLLLPTLSTERIRFLAPANSCYSTSIRLLQACLRLWLASRTCLLSFDSSALPYIICHLSYSLSSSVTVDFYL